MKTRIEGAEIVLGVMPSHHARGLYTAMLPHLTPSMILVSATKGLEQGSLLRMSEVIEQVVKAKFAPRIAVLSGPTFAREVAAGNPTAVVVASASPEVARCVQEAFSGPSFRLYTNADPVRGRGRSRAQERDRHRGGDLRRAWAWGTILRPP